MAQNSELDHNEVIERIKNDCKRIRNEKEINFQNRTPNDFRRVAKIIDSVENSSKILEKLFWEIEDSNKRKRVLSEVSQLDINMEHVNESVGLLLTRLYVSLDKNGEAGNARQ